MNPVLSSIVGSAGIVLLILLFKSLRASKVSGHVTPTFVFASALVILTNLTSTVSQFSGGRVERYTQLRQAIVTMSAPATMASQLVAPGIICAAAAYCLYRLGRPGPKPLNTAAALFLLLLLISSIAGGYNELPLIEGPRLAFIAAVVAITLAPRSMGLLRGAAYGIGLLVALSALLSITAPVAASSVCDLRKCGLLGGLYNGTSFSFNTFGMMMAVAVPVLYFGLSRYRMIFVHAAAVLGFASGSRSSQLAIVLTLVLLYAHHLYAKKGKKLTLLPVGAAVVAICCCIALPLLGLPDETFTGRARLWQIGMESFAESPFIGNGANLWSTFQSTGLITRASAYGAHNLFVDILFVSGLVGLALYIAMSVDVVRRNKGNLGRLALLVLPALILGSTERPWTIGDADWLSWAFLVVLATAFPAPSPSDASPLPNEKGMPLPESKGRPSILVKPVRKAAPLPSPGGQASVLVQPRNLPGNRLKN